jgi:DNA topoisomerase-1
MPLKKEPKAPKATKVKAAIPKKTSQAKGHSLLIVESPAKERTISRLLKGEFVVKSSFGHVRDLPVRKMGVDVDKGFKPDYTILPRAKKIIADLKKIAAKAPFVYLATDHDREGESIAWHLSDILGLSSAKARRITFHEITLPAIKEALASPRDIDQNLVGAQQARRIIDRLVGYELSPLLWEKIKKGLSAGRVQSVAVRLLVERELEIKEFSSDAFWTVTALLCKKGFPPFSADLTLWNGEKVEALRTFELFAEPYRVRLSSLKTAEDVKAIEAAMAAGNFKVISAERKETRRRAPAPFSTSTLQQAASLKLGFTAERTMRTAQSLYEGVDLGNGETVGLITYMRTDSFFVSKVASAEASSFVKERFGATYAPDSAPVYQTKTMAAQEAHEAIRPTSVLREPRTLNALLNSEQIKLYDLIWKRFLASQMKEALYDTIAIDVECGPAVFHALGRTLKFDGFLKVYAADKEGDDSAEEPASPGDKILPPLEVGDSLNLVSMKSEDRKTGPPARYNEASLIRTMEKHGIGRPSTYAPTIKTIVDRGYARRQKDRQLLVTELGTLVIEKLKVHFPEVVSLGYTAEVEGRLDKVAEGQEAWASVVGDFYKPFLNALKKAEKEMTVSRIEPKKTDEICPLCASPMLLRESRFGQYISCSKFPECKGKITLGADGQKIEPEKTDEVCDVCGKGMVIRTGRKGRFLACSGYPTCKNTFSLDAEGKKIPGSRPLPTARLCDKCKKPMWLRRGKRGHFLACSGFPRCRNLKPLSKEDGESLRIESEVMFLKNAVQKNGG